LDDNNNLKVADNAMYRSSYGPTIDGLQKPELIAPGIWVAAPILPGTPTAIQAALLSKLESATDAELRQVIRQNPGIDGDLDQAVELPAYLLRQIVWVKVRDNNIISGNYKHVDGTSFAAPIVSSVVAQLLEADPNLRPHEVKRVLIETAARLPNVVVDRQGWGVINPRAALNAIISRHGLQKLN
jgi:serine protease AprX